MTRRFWMAAAWCVLLAAGCGSEESTRTENMTPAPTEIRHDLDPLTKRFPVIARPVSAAWVTWNSASGGLPGPTTYWIDAVINLEPATTQALDSQYQPTDQGKRPNVQEMLRPEVPAGPFVSGTALDQALSTSGWRTSAYLDQPNNRLVISAMDD